MRIISGKYKGKSIVAPKNLPVRPTTDFAKTGLFNILQNRFDLKQTNCLDLFSGTGNISLEFISRGCPHVTAVDIDKGCISFLKDTSNKLAITNLEVIKSEVFDFLKKNLNQFSIIFADPPFEDDYRSQLIETIFKTNILKKNGVLILEHITGETYESHSGFSFSRSYGNVTFSFFFNFDESANPSTTI